MSDCPVHAPGPTAIICGPGGVQDGALAEDARNLHRFATPLPMSVGDQRMDHLFDARSGLQYVVTPRLGDLVESGEAPAGRSSLADESPPPTDETPDETAGYARLLDHMRQAAAAAVSAETAGASPPAGAYLLMYGTLTCNLACGYCNSRRAREKAEAGTAPAIMPLETARRSIRFMAERMAGRAAYLYANFTLGGEPLLAMDRFVEVKEFCGELSRELGFPVGVNLNTNGTGMSEEFVHTCEEHAVAIAISMDGPRGIHDAMRRFPSGAGSYDAVARNLPHVFGSRSASIRDAPVGAVLTALHPEPRRVYEHLIDLGFRHVVVTPVRDEPRHPWSLNADTVGAFRSGYTEYAAWLLDRLAAEDDRVYAALIEHDFFARFLIRLINRAKHRCRCDAARNTFGVGIDGTLYPCDSFAGIDACRLGSVWEGVDEERRAAFLAGTDVDEKPTCRDCWARYLCGGGCAYAATLANGDPHTPHAAKCELIRHLVELAIWLTTELRLQNPKAHERLCNSVLAATSAAVAPLPREGDR